MDQEIDELERRLREDPDARDARRALIEGYRRQGERRRLFRQLCEAARRGDDAALAEVESWNWRYSGGRVYPYRGTWSVGAALAPAPGQGASIGAVTEAVAVFSAEARQRFLDPRSFAELWVSEPSERFLDLVGDDALMLSGDELILRDGRSGAAVSRASLASYSKAVAGFGETYCHDRLIVCDVDQGYVLDLGEDFGRRLYSLPGPGGNLHWARGHLLTTREADGGEGLLALDARGKTLCRLPGAGPLIHGRQAACSGLIRGCLVERGYSRAPDGGLSSSLMLVATDLSACQAIELVLEEGRLMSYEALVESDAFGCWTAIGDELIMTELLGDGRACLMRLDAGAFSKHAPRDFTGAAFDRVVISPESDGVLWVREFEGLADLLRCQAGVLVLQANEGRERLLLLDADTGATLETIYEAERAAGPPPRLIPGPRGFFIERPNAGGELALIPVRAGVA